MRIINRTIWVLSMVSLFMDLASEMLYPVVPVYLKSIGFSLLWIGILEGMAEFTVGLSKGYFGQWSDRLGRRLPFVKLGYLMSAVAKPMMAIYAGVAWVFLARTMDRLGKGIRSAARDAMLSAATIPELKARVFNFHRGWDTTGAVMGPLLALWYLNGHPEQYSALFLFAIVPGLLAVAGLFLLTEKKEPPNNKGGKGFFSYLNYYRKAPKPYRQLTTALLLFALANSSDVFLLLRAKEISGSNTVMIAGYVFYNMVYAVSAYPMGWFADRWGLRKVMIMGYLLFALVYTGFWLNTSNSWIFILFGVYGLYAAATEGIAKAWISNLVPPDETATAIGFLGSGQSIVMLVASTLAGLLWETAGSGTVFACAAILSLLSIPMLIRVR